MGTGARTVVGSGVAATPDPTTVLCGILRGESAALPAGEAGERLLELARAHGVEWLVAWRTGRLDDEARGEAVLDELRVRELNRVLAALEAQGLVPLVFKGAALAHSHYPASWLRPRVDADILVPPPARGAAAASLRSLGYEARAVISGTLVSSQACFARIDDRGLQHVVDLHWRVADPLVVADVLTHEELTARAGAIDVRGCPVRIPAPRDALLLACVHRAAHHDDDESLLWLYDIHLLAAGLGRQDWLAFADEAVSRGVAALCARGLSLAATRFGTGLPEGTLQRLSARPALETSARYLEKGRRPAGHLVADIGSLNPRDGARLMWEHLFPPAAYMRAKYGARGRTLLPALYLRRLFTGVPRWLALTPRRSGTSRIRTAARSSTGCGARPRG